MALADGGGCQQYIDAQFLAFNTGGACLVSPYALQRGSWKLAALGMVNFAARWLWAIRSNRHDIALREVVAYFVNIRIASSSPLRVSGYMRCCMSC